MMAILPLPAVCCITAAVNVYSPRVLGTAFFQYLCCHLQKYTDASPIELFSIPG